MKIKLSELKCITEKINLDKYIEFRELVKKEMTYPEWLGDFSKKDLQYLLHNDSKIWIYYLDRIPICSMMIIPADEKTIKKFNVNLDYKEIIDYGPMMVNPKFIGNKLQYQMLEYLEIYCKKLGYKYAIGTIHPDNIYSINNLIKNDFKLIGQKEFTRGIRNIYIKEYNND